MKKRDYTGKKFGHLQVLYKDIEMTRIKKRSQYLCRCEKCGKEKVISSENLIRQQTCGCGQGNEFLGKERQCINQWRSRAKKRNIEFNITENDLVWPTHCPLLGYELRYREPGQHPNTASLDRKDNSLGYVPGNVWIISTLANRIKNSATLEECSLLVENWKKVIE